MKGVLSTIDLDDASLVAKAKASPGLVGRDLVREVMPEQARNWQEPLSEWTHLDEHSPSRGIRTRILDANCPAARRRARLTA